jgi:CPA2 family monovalent cation:H+ antiporter-2
MHEPQILMHIVAVFGTSVVAACLFRVIGLPSIIGYLFTGMVIGPSGFGFIPEKEVAGLAEMGLVLLLFTIGLELSPKPLLRMGKSLLFAAGLQIGATTVLAAGVVGIATTHGLTTSLIIGIVVALSSTAIVLKQLSDRGETGTVSGMITTGILLLQDVIVIGIMLFLPLLALTDEASWQGPAMRGGMGLIGLALAAVFGRRVLSVFVTKIVRVGGRESVALFAVLMACGGAWLAALAGWSPALGACVAGLLLAELDVRHQLVADIMPFRDVFNALFFVSLGMKVNFEMPATHLAWIAVAIVVTLLGKTIVTSAAVKIAGWPIRPALHAGIGLCTVSEFGYVLGIEAEKLGILPVELLNGIIVYAVGSMMIGAMLVPMAGPLSNQIVKWLRSKDDIREPVSGEAGSHHVIIIGYGINGQNLARVLRSTHIHHTIIEMNPSLVEAARETGAEVVVGDAERRFILEHAGISHAHALVVAINDAQSTQRVVSVARTLRSDLFILARTRYVTELDALYQLGADRVIPEDFETSIEISAHVLKEMDIPDNIVEAQIAAVRVGRYGMLRGQPTDRAAQEELMQVLQATVTRTHYVTSESLAVGKSIAELNLRALTGASIIAAVRNGRPMTNPAPDFTLAAGDVLVLVGAHIQLEQAKALLQVSH